MSRSADRKKNPTFRQKLLLVLFGLGVLGLAELGLRLIPSGPDHTGDPFVGFSRLNPLYERYRAGDGSERARTAPGKAKWFNEADFSVKKPARTFRIFTLGGSTTYGHPYSNPTSFSGCLEKLLNAGIKPGRSYEVINAGGISYASYRVAMLLDEHLAYKPDLVIVLTGHNEFLEARTYGELIEQPGAVLETRSLLNRSRLYREMNRGIGRLRGERRGAEKPEDRKAAGTTLEAEVETLLDQSAGLDLYQRDSLFSHGVFEHFRYNVRRMISRCREEGVEIVFCDPVDNLKDFSPFKSMFSAGLTAEGRANLSRSLQKVSAELAAGNPSAALVLAGEAAETDPLYAETFFLLGRARLATDDTSGAFTAFHRARELDVCPLRAQEPIHAILREECRSSGTTLLDIPALFAARSPGGIIGNEMLMDHIHPTVEGNVLIAAQIAEWMQARGMTGEFRMPDEKAREDLLTAIVDPLPSEYFSQGVLNLVKTLTWAKKYEEANALMTQHWQELSGNGETWYLRATELEQEGNYEAALEHYRQALARMPEHRQSMTQAARMYEALGRFDEAGETYTRALARYPDDIPLRVNHAIMLARLGDHERAGAEFRRALELDPDSPEVLNNLGLLLIMQKDFEAAMKHLRHSIDELPNNPQAHNYLGVAFLQQGLAQEAEREFAEAVRQNPEHVSARTNLANVYLRTGRHDLAEEQLKTALTINPNLAEAWLNLCLLYRDNRREAQFREALAQALLNCPNDPRIKQLAGEN